MAECKYILQLPGGGTVKLPSKFSTLEKDESIDKLFLNYSSASDETKPEALKELREALQDKLPDSIHGKTVNTIIQKSANIDEVRDKLNTLIESSGNYENIGDAIYNYIKAGAPKKGGRNTLLDDLLADLRKERTPKYFKNFGLSGVIGTSNVKSEKNRIYAKDIENKEFGFSTDVTSNLNTFLNSLIQKDSSGSESNVLYGNTNSFIGKALSTDEVVLYELNDDLSLFLGLFKREAVKVEEEVLMPIVQKINELLKFKKYSKLDELNLGEADVDNFFNGKITDKVILPSKFELLLEAAKEVDIAKDIDEILKLISNTIKEGDYSLSLAIRKLFWALSPNSYGKNNLFTQLNNKKQITEEAKIEQEYKKGRLSFLEMETSDIRDNFFSENKEITENHFENATKNIILNKDLVRFPIENMKNGIFGLVTGIYKREKGVAIYGVYKNQNGELETLSYTYKDSDDIVYRKRENAIDPYIIDEPVIQTQGAVVTSETAISPEVIKRIIRKGDVVSGNVVLGVYPSYLMLKTIKGPQKISGFKSIRTVRSAIALQELANEVKPDISQYTQTNNGEDLSEGDYFLFENKGKKFYKRILYTDAQNVYSWVPGKKPNDPAVIKATPRTGLVGLKDAYGELDAKEIKLINSESNLIGRSSATLSSFTDPKNAREGDFFFFIENGIKMFGKVLHNDKALVTGRSISDRTIQSLKTLKDVQFLTSRDISSNFSFFSFRVNSMDLNFDTGTDLDVEVKYMIPVGTELSKVTMMPNGYANIGTYRTLETIQKNKESVPPIEEEDITEFILKALNKDKSTKIYFQKESPTSFKYVRNLDSLTWIKYFDKLDLKTKQDLDVLQPGAYFSVYRAGDIDFNIYRVMSIEGDVVKAHLNKISKNGDVITIERDFTKSELLNSDITDGKAAINSIARLYMQNGNNKMSNVIKETNRLNVEGDREFTNKSINYLIKSLKKYAKGLKMDIELVPANGNFTNGQKAKIITREDGTTAIQINEDLGTTVDVLHEFLHLFLTPLRYKHPEIYGAFIKSVVKDEALNVTDAEEEFVRFVSGEMIKGNDFIDNFEDLATLVKGLQLILKDANVEYQIKAEDNPVSLLNTSLMQLFDINTEDQSHPMMNLAMVTTEPMMREWMKNNNIILNCS